MGKKLLSIMMVLALMFTTMNYVPKQVKAAQSDVQNYDWSSVDYIGCDGSALAYVNKVKVAVVDNSQFDNYVNIQTGAATQPGIYMTFQGADFGDILLNGEPFTSYDVQGAGMWIHVAALGEYNDLVVKNASGATKAELYIYKSEVEEESGEQPSETQSEQNQSEARGELLPGLDQWNTYPAGAVISESGVTATVPAVTGGDNWTTQLVKNGIQLVNGKYYKASVTLTSSVARKFQLLIQNDAGNGAANWNVNNSETTFSVEANEAYTFTTVFQASSASNPVLFGIMMGFVAEASDEANVTVSAASLVEYDADPSQGGEQPSETQTPEPETFGAPKDLAAYNFYGNGKGYQVCFTESVDAVSYNVYMDDSDVLATVTKTDQYINASVFSAYADNALHTLAVEAVDAEGNVSAKSTTKVRVTTLTNSNNDPSDISRVYVVTNSDKKIEKSSKTKASLTVVSGDGAIKSVHYGGTIKLRGNSTSLADKPAYNISFNKKQEVISGVTKGKKWCLLANAYEKTMMRNKLAMDFGKKLGNVAAPAEHYSDLYIDGVYMGTFVISEPAENGRSEVSYNEDGDDVLIELEQNGKDESADGAAYYTTSRLGRRFACEDLADQVEELYKSGVTSQDAIANNLRQNYTKFSSMITTLNDFETDLVNSSSDAMLSHIDVDSFVSMYIVNELFQTVDFGYSSVKFYITYDENHVPTIHAGPLWDFDLSSGNSADGSCRTYNTFRGQNVNPWFSYLMKNNTFKNKVIAKYTAMQPTIQNIYRDNALGLSQIHQNEELMEASRIRNYSIAGWSESVADSAEYNIYNYSYSTVAPYSTYTYDQHIEYLTNWLKNRNEWICGQWGIDYTAYESEYNPNGTISEDLDITGYQMTSTYNGEEGRMGLRVIFQTEETVNGEVPVESGLVYGLDYDGSITENDVVVGSDSRFVASFDAPRQNKMSKQMGDSATASYYSMVMNTGQDNVSAAAFTTTYFVRAYAKMSDGSYVYSKVYSYTVFRVAKYLYNNILSSNAYTHDFLYEKVLAYVDPSFRPVEYDWSKIITHL
ncbi:MAG: CotH kinase family protein [Eubacterium sp.]|nr:CotH kinase family protein [Eubacterium sp.]